MATETLQGKKRASNIHLVLNRITRHIDADNPKKPGGGSCAETGGE